MGGHHFDLVSWHVEAKRLAVFTALEIVIGTLGAFAQDAELAGLHALNLGDLSQKRFTCIS
jgi:hypothetical protein